jgi:predicted lipoprotein with Yx(FWY)xxD motif
MPRSTPTSARISARVLAVLAAAAFALAVGATGAGAAAKTTVTVTKVPSVGAVLATTDGHTLYTLTDANGAAVDCSGACLSAWPAYTVAATAKVKAPKGVKSLSTTVDTHQVTWKGLPLYTFAGDSAAKMANGNGITSFGGTWSVVKPTTKAASTTPTTAKQSSGYSGY